MPENQASTCPVPSGILVIIGGKENKGGQQVENRETPEGFHPLQIHKHFLDLVQKDDPLIEIITTASGDGDESFEDYKKVFEEMGVKRIGHIRHETRKQVLEEDVSSRVKEANAFFFTGGDQLLLTSIYGGTAFLTELKKRYISERIVIAGTSAGAMALSTPMIYAGNAEVQLLTGQIKVTTGLEFLKDVCIDTHFVHRGRFIRLAQVIATNATCIGLGIEEDTAVIVTNGVDAKVIGSGTVIVMDGFNITDSNVRDFTEKRPVTIRDLRVDILADQQTFTIPQTNPPHI